MTLDGMDRQALGGLLDSDSLLDRLCGASGVSGHEAGVHAVLDELLGSYVDRSRVDALGNWVGTREPRPAERQAPGEAPVIVITAHLDAIGLMVTAIEEGGFLRFSGVGGWDPRQLPAQAVTVHGREDLPGMVGSRPPHLLSEQARGQVLPMDELFIDVGLPEEAVRRLVAIGDVATLRRPVARLAGQRRAGPAMDNRASWLALVLAMRELSGRDHEARVHLLATVQEEVGRRGAGAAAWELGPDLALVLDVTFAGQFGQSPVPGALGGGPCIGRGPNLHPQIGLALGRLAGRLELKHGWEALSGDSGTDAWPIQVARDGVPCGLLSIPVRYMHSAVEAVDLTDVERCARLVAAFGSAVDAAFVAGLSPCVAEADLG